MEKHYVKQNTTTLLKKISNKNRPIRVRDIKLCKNVGYLAGQTAWRYLEREKLIVRDRNRKIGGCDTFILTAKGHRSVMAGFDLEKRIEDLYYSFINEILTIRKEAWLV